MKRHSTTYILSWTLHTYIPSTLIWTPTIKGKLTSRLHTRVLAKNKNTMIVCIYTSNKLGPFQIRYNEVTVVWRSIIYYSADFKYQELEVNDKVPTAHCKKKLKNVLELSTLLLSKTLVHSKLGAIKYQQSGGAASTNLPSSSTRK